MADYLMRIDGRGSDDRLNLIVEVSGQPNNDEKKAKTGTVRTFWIPAVNSEGMFERSCAPKN